MSALLSISFKLPSGGYKNYTVSVSDETNKHGQNVSVWEEQTKDQRTAKAPKKYAANGKVLWNDGKITNAVKVEKTSTSSVEDIEIIDDSLPF